VFIVIVFVFFIVLFGLAALLRKYLERCLHKPQPYRSLQHVADTATEETAEKEIPLWLEELSEAEQEAAALVLGFLTMQTLVSLVTGRKNVSIHDLHQERQFSEVACMQAAPVVFLLVLVVVSFMVHFFRRDVRRSIFNFRGYLAMSMAWCVERAGGVDNEPCLG